MEVTETTLARQSDAKEISRLSRKLVEYDLYNTKIGYSEKRVSEAIRHESKNVIVSKQGKILAGFAIMTYHDEIANLDLLAVLPSHQGTGLAKEIVEWLETVAINAGIFTIQVQARQRNKQGIRFYEKLGYEIIDKVPRVYGVETQIRLSRNLC